MLFTWCFGQGNDHLVKLALNPLDSQVYVWIPPGTFQMGCSVDHRACQEMEEFSNENPRHTITISKGFWMGQTEVTVGAYRNYTRAAGNKSIQELVEATPERFRDAGFPQSDDHPMAYVAWEDAEQYCECAGGRLPAEAEWEYAARAGIDSARYGKLEDIAWYADNSGQLRLNSSELEDRQIRNQILKDNGNDTHPVKGKVPNDFGLYDMLGNVTEYCKDWYDSKYYVTSVELDPVGPSSGAYRVIRGGSYSSRPLGVRGSWRSYMLMDHRFKSIGFRCVLDTINATQ